MITAFIVLSVLALCGIASTVVSIARDGYHRLPARPLDGIRDAPESGQPGSATPAR